MRILFWGSLAVLLWVWVGYPLILLVASKFKRSSAGVYPSLKVYPYPSVSLIIPAHNEEEVMEAKLKNALLLNYPGKLDVIVALDGSTDHTAQIVAKFTQDVGTRYSVSLLNFTQRRGKMATLNEAVRAVDSEIVALTDANTIFEKDAIKRLIAHFRDPNVGCVCGVKSITPKEGTGKCENIYWRFENFLKDKESQIGSCVADGSIYAVRRKLFPFPREDRIIMDDLAVSLGVINKNYRVIFEREAVAYEDASLTASAEFKRKIRILEGALTAVISSSIRKVAFQIVSHKILRWLGGFFMLSLLISNLFIQSASGRFYQIFLALQLCFYLLAVVGFGLTRVAVPILSGRKHKTPTLFYTPFYFCLTNVAQIVGFFKYIKGNKEPFWEKTR